MESISKYTETIKITTTALILLVALQGYTQNFVREFGKISQEELDLKSYNRDPESGAVVLFDIGDSKFYKTTKGFDIRFRRHKRIKVFDKESLVYAEVTIPYYSDGHGIAEVVNSIEAITYNYENGKLIKHQLDPSLVYKEQIGEDLMAKKFVLPNAQEGSILEFKYILETPFHFNLPDWTFQDRTPTIHSEYTVRMIPFFEYTFIAQGITEFDYQKLRIRRRKTFWGNLSKLYGQNTGSGVEFQDHVHTYVLKDVPAFKDESYISSIDDYIIKMDFQQTKFNNRLNRSNDVVSGGPMIKVTPMGGHGQN